MGNGSGLLLQGAATKVGLCFPRRQNIHTSLPLSYPVNLHGTDAVFGNWVNPPAIRALALLPGFEGLLTADLAAG